MALQIKQIIERGLLEGAKLVAGSKGIDNPVSWVNVMEILDSPDSVQKGELLVSTGYHLENEELYGGLITRLRERNVSGLAIQPGYYISKIPDYILKTADKEGFPILELPTNLTFSAIMHTLMEEIGIQSSEDMDSKTKQLCNTLMESLNKSEQEFLASDTEERYLFLVNYVGNSSAGKSAVQNGFLQIKSYLMSQANDKNCNYQILNNDSAAFCVNIAKENSYQDVVFELTVQLTFLSEQQNLDFYVGVSRLKEKEDLEKSFERSMDCIRLLERIEARRGVCPYDNIPFFELFDRIQRNNRSILLGSEALQKLFEYDRFNQTRYVYTLRVFLANAGNTSKAASRMFIHRHTLINRLQKITDLCELNLSNYYTRIYLSLALLVHDFFAI